MMATAKEGTSIYPYVHKYCDGCCNNPATNYCAECESNICDNCSASHSRLKATHHHALTPIGGRWPQSTNQVKCSIHLNVNAVAYCKTCYIRTCQNCEYNHSKHDMLIPSGDLCRRLIQKLYESESKLQEMKKTYQQNIQLRKEANIMITEVGNGLMYSIKTAMNYSVNHNLDVQTNLLENIKIIDVQLGKLDTCIADTSKIRNDSGKNKQLQEMLQSARILNENFLFNTPTEETLGNLLPNIDSRSFCLHNVRSLFNTDEYLNVKSIPSMPTSNITIAQPACSLGYKFAKGIDHPIKGLLAFGDCTPDLRRFDTSRNSFLEQAELPLNVAELISISNDQYVAIDEQRHRLHLWNDKFQIIETAGTNGAFVMVQCASADKFLVCEMENTNVSDFILKMFDIVAGQFIISQIWPTLNLKEWPISMTLHKRTLQVTFAMKDQLTTINLYTNTRKDINISSLTKVVSCVLVNGTDDILIGDSHGKIFNLVFSKNAIDRVTDTQAPIVDMFFANGKLLVSTKNNIVTYTLKCQ